MPSLYELAKNIKDTRKNELVMYKSGSFYKIYGNDAYLMSYLFGYSVQKLNENTVFCGFPLNSLGSVTNKLENKKINYTVIDPKSENKVEEKKEFNNLNAYEAETVIAIATLRRKNDINKITERLNQIIDKVYFKEVIRKIEDILDENREI